MRHRRHFRKLNRTSEHRKALHRNLAQSLIEHGQVTTTLAKAKDLRPFFERIVTLAVKTRTLAGRDPAASLRARRRIHRMLSDRSMIPAEHREAYEEMSDAARAKTLRMPSGRRHRTGDPKGRLAFTAESVTHRLIDSVAARFEERPGGYTRLIRLAKRRKGDDSVLAIVQILGDEEPPMSLTKPKRSARRRRADARYAAAVKAAKARSRPSKSAASGDAPQELEGASTDSTDTSAAEPKTEASASEGNAADSKATNGGGGSDKPSS